jgi:hypothetical protein
MYYCPTRFGRGRSRLSSLGPLREASDREAVGNGPKCWRRTRDTILAVPFTDTSPSAQAVQLRVQQAMTGEQRLLMAFEMSMFARELSEERIRLEHPEWPETQVARELLRLAFLPAQMPAPLR